MVIADFGCGTAKLAQSGLMFIINLKMQASFNIILYLVKSKVHSFDLVAANDLVTPCDMKNVPLTDKSCDIVVFCLSLMGKNITDFICEAHRILKLKYADLPNIRIK